MRKIKIVLLVLLIIFVLIQFIRPTKNQSTGQELTTDIARIYVIPKDVQTILRNACYDCHSNNTQYPWYVNIEPVGWLMTDHIKKGKKELNFNEYSTYSSKRQRNKLKRMKEQIEENEMPLYSYTLMHPDARLTANQKEQVTKWIDSTLNITKTRSTN